MTKTQYNSDKQGLEKKTKDGDKKIPNTKGLVRKTDCNTKITEIENKVLEISNPARKAALNTKASEIKNKIPDTTGFIATSEFNKLTKISFDQE